MFIIETLKSKTSFCVYADNGYSGYKCENDSFVSKNNSVTLRKGEVVALAGEAKESFKICIK